MKFRPLHDRVVIRRIEGEEKTKGRIIAPSRPDGRWGLGVLRATQTTGRYSDKALHDADDGARTRHRTLSQSADRHS